MDGAIWLWVGFWGMALGFAAIAFLSRGAATEEQRNGAVLHAMVPAVAAVFYLLMATGQGEIPMLATGRTFYFARYIDWSITTPMLLIGLAFTALGTLRGNVALVSAAVLSDVLMIVTGLIAGSSPTGSPAKWIWFAISCGFFVAVYYVIWGPLARQARPEAAAGYRRNAAVLSVLWLAYPVVFALGSEGVGVLAPAQALAIFAILDLLAKVGYGLLTVSEHKARR